MKKENEEKTTREKKRELAKLQGKIEVLKELGIEIEEGRLHADIIVSNKLDKCLEEHRKLYAELYPTFSL